MSLAKGCRLVAAAIVLGALVAAGPARGEIVEDHLLMATQSTATHLFPLNPANRRITAAQAGVLVMRSDRTSRLDMEDQGGDSIKSRASDDFVAFAGMIDLGAGAGLGLSHQTLFHKVETEFGSQTRAEPKLELMKQQHSALQLTVELTDWLAAGMAIRYLYKDVVLFGAPSLDDNEITRYKTTLVGYGSGFSVHTERGGVSYSYFPPLRGKSDIEGEERIIVEPGEIVVDAAFLPTKDWTVGLLGKKWLNELDDRAKGTTASDNETDISLFGLDPDQYVLPTQLIMVGVDHALTPAASLAVSAGQEQAEFNFRDLMRYDRVDVRQSQHGGDAHESVKYNRYRAMVKFDNQGIELTGGAGLFSRQHDLPASMGSASYQADGKELFATISMKL
jgi:hypothetical protein